MDSLSDRMEFAALAHRRYPSVELPLAIEFLKSDRSHAGLGALDERKRNGRHIRNYKRDVLEHGQVRYHLIRHMPRRLELPPVCWDDYRSGVNFAEQTVTLIDIPERTQHLCVPADYRDLREQSGRRRIAAALREARRQLKDVVPPPPKD